MNRKSPKAKRSARITAALVMLLVFGAGIMLYPTFSEWYNRANASTAVNDYNRTVERQTKEERDRIRTEAETYNQILADETIRNGGTIDQQNTVREQLDYQDVFHLDEEGIMGYISIPEISVRLPIYHGTDEKELHMGIGHLEGSSLPVGGASTNCVLVGHTGLPTARMFTDIDRLETGDRFQLTILNGTLTYEVGEIRVVLPMDVDSLRMEEGQDQCTLLTCTPYGINDHRLLVIGNRIDTPGTAGQGGGAEEKQSLLQMLYPYRTLFLAIAIVAAVVIFTTKLIPGRNRRNRTGTHRIGKKKTREKRSRQKKGESEQ